MRKLTLATAKDPRVIIIKLCDRLHNMQTLQDFRKEKQERIAKHTLQVYAPIAEKLGLPRIKGELQDWALRYMDPEMYYFLKENIGLKRAEREKNVLELVDEVSQLLAANGVRGKITGRAKYFYSIARKMNMQSKNLDDIHDLYGIRVIVDEEKDCYAVLEYLKDRWDFVKNRYKDYIQNPKANQYKSIHANFRVRGKMIEVQIRTRDMDDLAESGAAMHWKYKQTERDKKFDQKINWLRQLLQRLTSESVRTGKELNIDVFQNQIIAVTPKGDPIILPEGATAIDFAYAVHTSVGNHAIRAEVNDQVVPLATKLKSGDIVRIITGKHMSVSQAWLKDAVSTETIAKIRRALKISSTKTPGKRRKQEEERLAFREHIDTLTQLEEIAGKTPIKISKCCSPKRGDKIVAFYTKGKRTITVHRADCPNQYALDQRYKLKMDWTEEQQQGTHLEILAVDEAGLLREMLDVLFGHDVGIRSISFQETKNNLRISVGVGELSDTKQKQIIAELKDVHAVSSARFLR